MTWSLSATGHIATPKGERNSLALEEKLLAELRAVLAKPEYGAHASLLRGTHVVNTQLHVPDAPAKTPRAAEGKPAATTAPK